MPTVAKERIIPKGRGLFEDNFDRMLIELVDMINVGVAARGRGACARICREFPGEDDIIGSKGFAIMPHYILFEPPGDRPAILRQPTIVQTRNVCGQDWDKVGVWVKRCQWLVDNAGGIHVLSTRGQMGIENSGRLPPEQAQLAPSTTLGGDELCSRLWSLRLGRGRGRQQMAQAGARQPQSHHVLEKGPPIRHAMCDA